MTIAVPTSAASRASAPSTPISIDWTIGFWAAAAAMAAALFHTSLLSDGDTAWHLAAGEWMLRHGQVPH
ncbi:MAG: hypothetical protein JO303_14920, partial [Caulobacteraceae bacterium]|nr:hypothetical protein [Caulobacteraceae bacterium]